jgi:cation diffusion facilitator CzcD-associated flavoprotein CzcO
MDTHTWKSETEIAMDATRTARVLIVGSGGNGISPAVKLGRAGLSDFLIISKDGDFGGTWYTNTYPGCAVDATSSVYQFSYALTSSWSELCPPQPEIKAYMQGVARDNGLYERAHFNTEMTGAEWDDDGSLWIVSTTQGEYQAQVLVLATGALEEAVVPTIPGAELFEGRLFHSARWPDGYTAEGDRVAVVGSGSSGIQIVPAMQKVAASVTQFVRTPTWLIPKDSGTVTADNLLEHRREEFARYEGLTTAVLLAEYPEATAEVEAECLQFLEQEIADPALRELLTPTHPFACKRPVISDDYFASLNAPNVHFVPEAAAEIGPRSITSAGGRTFEVDTIVFATGFHLGGHILDRVARRDGRSVGSYQAGHPRAYKSVSVAGCPNLFLVAGPNGQIWHGIHPGEAVGTYIVKALQHMREHGIRALEVREAAEVEWKRQADEILDRGPAVSGGCTNYFQDEHGHNKAIWPGSLEAMTAALEEFDVSAYEVIDQAEAVPAAGGAGELR